ncbi:hypothetical protein ACN4A9_03070, partial [Corynebacterium macclintockiae]|uniref:hypothetical protein n=1 Tax=Corynebacterium macclintockiae TaxID=2913501 RepID=UPI003EC12795
MSNLRGRSIRTGFGAKALGFKNNSRECPIVCVRGLGLQVFRESVWVCHSQLVDGLFPAIGLRSFNIP